MYQHSLNRKWKETNLPCPCGTSSDAFSLDVEGNGFCFRGNCRSPYFSKKELDKSEFKGYNDLVNEAKEIYNNYSIYTNSNITRSNKLKEINTEEFSPEVSPSQKITADFYSHRGISRKAYEFYGVYTKFIDGVPTECGFQLPNKSFQIKQLDPNVKKRYRTEGPYSEAGLFGRDKFDPGSRESVTIVEGYHDALAAWEMLNDTSAVVSVKSSSTAKSDCIKDWEFINSFKKIILCLDNDEPGLKATREIAGLFDFSKVHQVKLTKYKDANKYLEEKEVQTFVQAWKSSRKFSPDNIISSFEDIKQALKTDTESQLGTYPFKSINDMTYGLHEGEVIVIKAPEGVGKTEFFRACEHHLLTTTQHNIGVIHLEEDNGTTIKALAGYHLQLPAVLPDSGVSDEEVFVAYKKLVKDDENRVHIYSSFDQEDEQQLLDNIRFLVSAAGCKFVFLDHITWLATGKEDDDERKKLDRLSQKLKLLAKELRFCLIMISHVNDDGKTRGSRNISKVANTVISLDRDKINFDPNVRNTIEFLLEKVRLGGNTGRAGSATFNQMKGILEDNKNEPIS